MLEFSRYCLLRRHSAIQTKAQFLWSLLRKRAQWGELAQPYSTWETMNNQGLELGHSNPWLNTGVVPYLHFILVCSFTSRHWAAFLIHTVCGKCNLVLYPWPGERLSTIKGKNLIFYPARNHNPVTLKCIFIARLSGNTGPAQKNCLVFPN